MVPGNLTRLQELERIRDFQVLHLKYLVAYGLVRLIRKVVRL